nr:hypothetical protein [Angustibacter aerolatus]
MPLRLPPRHAGCSRPGAALRPQPGSTSPTCRRRPRRRIFDLAAQVMSARSAH